MGLGLRFGFTRTSALPRLGLGLGLGLPMALDVSLLLALSTGGRNEILLATLEKSFRERETEACVVSRLDIGFSHSERAEMRTLFSLLDGYPVWSAGGSPKFRYRWEERGD